MSTEQKPAPVTGPNHGVTIPDQFRLLRALIGTQDPQGLQDMRDVVAYLESVCPKETPSPAESAEIETARSLYASDDVEIDDDAEASRADQGVWVAAWVWISDAEIAGETSPMPEPVE